MSRIIKNPVMAATNKPGENNFQKQSNDNSEPSESEYVRLYRLDWLSDFEMLAAKYTHLGFTPDLACMTILEARGLYQWLQSLE